MKSIKRKTLNTPINIIIFTSLLYLHHIPFDLQICKQISKLILESHAKVSSRDEKKTNSLFAVIEIFKVRTICN